MKGGGKIKTGTLFQLKNAISLQKKQKIHPEPEKVQFKEFISQKQEETVVQLESVVLFDYTLEHENLKNNIDNLQDSFAVSCDISKVSQLIVQTKQSNQQLKQINRKAVQVLKQEQRIQESIRLMYNSQKMSYEKLGVFNKFLGLDV